MLTAVSSQHLVINASYVLLPNTVITHGGCESHFCGFHIFCLLSQVFTKKSFNSLFERFNKTIYFSLAS